MISALTVPAAPESPSQHAAATTPMDQSPHRVQLQAQQCATTGNVLLSELAAAASAASRGIVLPPLRALVDESQPVAAGDEAHRQQQFLRPALQSVTGAPGASLLPVTIPQAPPPPQQPPLPAHSSQLGPPPPQPPQLSQVPQPDTHPTASSQQSSPNGPYASPQIPQQALQPAVAGPHAPQGVSQQPHQPAPRYPTPPVIALSQASPHPHSPNGKQTQESHPATHTSLSAPLMQLGNPKSPALAAPSPSGSTSSSTGAVSPMASAPVPTSTHGISSASHAHATHTHGPAHPAAVPTTTTPAPAPAAQQPQSGKVAHAQHRVLAPAPSPLVPSPHGHVLSHPQHPQQHPSQAPSVVLSPHPPPAGAVPAPHAAIRQPSAPSHVVYVNSYGYPYESVAYMYHAAAPPVPHYGYPQHHPGYAPAPIPMMHMPPPQHQVVQPSVAQGPTVPSAASATSPNTSSDVKSGMPHSHMMQPWTHTFSQEIKRRTRTGCLTCRRRRVKCDEQHPQCRNCLKSERVCLGYDVIFSFDRAKRVDHLMHRRRIYRASRRSKDRPLKLENVKLEENDTTQLDSDGEEERAVLRSWTSVVEMFRNRLAGQLDELLGSDMFLNIATRTADYLNAADQRFVNVAGELEVMRQLLAVVYPALSFEGLNILESQIALEKLRTTEDYCLLRAVAECFSAEEPGSSMQEMIPPTAAVRRTLHQQHLQRIYSRLALLHRILHPRRGEIYAVARPGTVMALNRAAHSFIVSAVEEHHADLTSHLWDYLNDTVPSDTTADTASAPSTVSVNLQDIPEVVSLAKANDARGVLALLATYARRPTEGELRSLLNSLSLRGLPMALLEIGMASRT